MNENKNVIEKSTLSEQVRHYILDLISTQQLRPGDKVPSEKQLIETLGVSRGVIREALQALSTLGILDISSGKLPCVQAVNHGALETIFNHSVVTQQITVSEILELRRTLEVQCVALAALFATADDLERLAVEMDSLRAAFGDHPRFILHDTRFHLILAEASGNPLYTLLLQALRGALANSIGAGLRAPESGERRESIIGAHKAIVDAVSRHDVTGAKAAMEAHFDSAITGLISGEKTEQA